jgi:hypothetical protein
MELRYGAEVMTAGHGAGQLSLSQSYQRLPHSLAQIIKEFPVVDGSDVRLLWGFLHRMLKIKQVARMSDIALFGIMYPFCRGELFSFVTDAISTSASFEHFHANLLRRFVPVRQITQLLVERYERVHEEREYLGGYVQAIRDAVAVLRIEESEAKMVERIVEGLSPVQRARFVFQKLPSTFRQL